MNFGWACDTSAVNILEVTRLCWSQTTALISWLLFAGIKSFSVLSWFQTKARPTLLAVILDSCRQRLLVSCPWLSDHMTKLRTVKLGWGEMDRSGQQLPPQLLHIAGSSKQILCKSKLYRGRISSAELMNVWKSVEGRAYHPNPSSFLHLNTVHQCSKGRAYRKRVV